MDKQKEWISGKTYEKVCNEIAHWPEWKRRIYNEIFATSKHAKRVSTE